MKTRFLLWRVFVLCLLAAGPGATAQWISQSFELKTGWNSIYLHVDLTHSTLRDIIDLENNPNCPIEEIWLWTPANGSQFTTDPRVPADTESQWSVWKRSAPQASTLQLLAGNSACLVKVSADYLWTVKGRPTPPRYQWDGSGLNFIGLASLPVNPPGFTSFLDPSGHLNAFQIFEYVPGSASPSPPEVIDLDGTLVQRGAGYWIKSSEFNDYFGPFALDLPSLEGARFGDSIGQVRLYLRNAASTNVTVTMALLPSEAAPANQPAVAGMPPLLLRGLVNITNLTYPYTTLNSSTPGTFTLNPKGQPGSEAEIVLGLDRTQMTGTPGDLFAGILRFTDSLNLSQWDVPASAVVASTAGLWVGEANVTHVRQYLKEYQKTDDGSVVENEDGSYVVSGFNTNLTSVPRPAKLRIILHHDPAGAGPVLLQRVYYGTVPTGTNIVATQEKALASTQLSSARRISAVHLPWTKTNHPWPMTGLFQRGQSLTANVVLNYDDQSSNPFLHTYHPDHDNLTADFSGQLPQGAESYRVHRSIRLTQRAPANDFDSLTAGGNRVIGEYLETITLDGDPSQLRTFEVRGVFSLGRISDISFLTIPTP